MRITQTALKFNTTVYVLIACIIVIGAISYRTLPLEAAPEVKVPMMIVSTIYPGVSPEDMERLVTNVMERELSDVKGLKKISSSSTESISAVTVEFESDVDLDVAYQKVKAKVDKARMDLPDDAEEPQIIEINFSEFPIMAVNLSGDYPLAKLKNIAEGIEEEIEQIPGVLGVDLAGGLDREIQVLLSPSKMEYHKISVAQVISRINQEHRTTPAGSIELGGTGYSVRIPGEYEQVSRMEDIVLKAPGGNPVKLKDIGRIVDGHRDRETISRFDGKESITLKIKKRAGENIVRIADDVRTVLAGARKSLPEGVRFNIQHDESKMVRNMVSDLENNIITGLILVLGVLLVAMGARNAFFVAIAIPLSMLITFIILQVAGITLNMVVLFSLILALGMLVDNSIVVVENIYRHVCEGDTRKQAALKATNEVAWPVIASTATTVMVFAPLIFWPGIMGDFMQYLPITVIAVLVSSLFVALVINPVVAASFLKVGKNKMFDDSGEARGWLIKKYEAAINWCLDHPKRVLAIAGGTFVLTVILFGAIGAGVEFFPQSTPERAQIQVTAPQGTVLERTDMLVQQVEALVRNEPNVKNVVVNVGVSTGNGLSAGGNASNSAVIDLEFKDRHERKTSPLNDVASIRKKLTGLTGADYAIQLAKNGPPTGDPVSVEVSGDDFNQLLALSREVQQTIAGIPGVIEIEDNQEEGKPEIRIDVNREEAMIRGVNTQSISMAVRAAINGVEASVLREGDEEYDIVVRYEKDARKSISDVLDIRVTGKDDAQIPLRDVARVRTAGAMGSISHVDQKRTITVSAKVDGRSSTEVMMDVKEAVDAQLRLPDGYTVNYAGESADQEESAAFLGSAFGIGLMLMALILITQFNSVVRPSIVLASVVMSMVGVLVGLMITDNNFGIIMTGLGVISLAGVVVNNAIVLIDYTDQLKEKLNIPLREALARAGVVRFRPVLLTAVTTILGLIPMAIGASFDFKTLQFDIGAPTTEMWGPMAQAVIFGLAFATVLTLIIVPVMYQQQENTHQWLKDRMAALSTITVRFTRRSAA
jgi:multidrug efflux pump